MNKLQNTKTTLLSLLEERKSRPELPYKLARILSELERKTWLRNTSPEDYIKNYNSGLSLNVTFLYLDFTDREQESSEDELAAKLAFVELVFEHLGLGVISYATHHKERCYDVDIELTVLGTLDYPLQPDSYGNHEFPKSLRLKIDQLKALSSREGLNTLIEGARK